ncbi:hypothetical protein K431DRAFT_283797 [Polychaeton citri CBS 116435]|uniref:Zn(2)-C6 fungal-type domain-containing protein n=1 Tax=Polychaeton citri CBS 116435 TaxID=1314669 RepID=A0A9P4QD69_9PEZI|nr:hypothetical protein K431DRAFT_283797 [Polychaeton citri CBS 116435]
MVALVQSYSALQHSPVCGFALTNRPMNEKVAIVPLRRSQPPPKPKRQVRKNSSEGVNAGGDSTDTNVRRKRASKPKVRTGCTTCKIRRVKCDETKPACTKCTSTGRKCDGYVEPQPKRRRTSPSLSPFASAEPSRSLDFVRGTDSELRALDFFRTRTAPSVGTYFDTDFWGRLVQQMGYEEPAIRHAMVAVGVLHEKREHGTLAAPRMRSRIIVDPAAMLPASSKSSFPDDDQVALSHYNKAIELLGRRMHQPGQSAEVALLACILFICLEFLRGDVEPALRHFRGGMGIIMGSIACSGSYKTNATAMRIRDSMLPFFNRLEILSALFGNDASWDYPFELHYVVADTFDSAKQARDSMVHLMNLCLRFIRSMKYHKYNQSSITPDHLAEQARLRNELYRWRSVFETYLARTAYQLTPDDIYAANVLEIHRLVAMTWLCVVTSPEEIMHDTFNREFETIVSLAEQMLSVASSRQQAPKHASSFLFDMEMVSPLYWVGIKCRHPRTRRRAIAVLRSVHRREGLWDSNMAAAVAQRCMELEEVGLSTLDGSELPSENMRIHNSYLQSEAGMNPTKHMITFQTKPNGLEGYWRIWQEQVILEPDTSSEGTPVWDHLFNDALPSTTGTEHTEYFESGQFDYAQILSEDGLAGLFPHPGSPRAGY